MFSFHSIFKKKKENQIISQVENVSIDVTNTCFFKCIMCSFWKNKINKKISDLKYYKKFLSDLVKIKSSHTLVTFTGGETLGFPHIFELVEFANRNGFITNLNTNGWLLNHDTCLKIFHSGLNKIAISLDGSTPALHDSIRNMPGSFERILNNIKVLKEIYKSHNKSIEITIGTVILEKNIHDIENIINLITNNEHINCISFQAVCAPLDEKQIIHNKVKGEFGNLIPWYEHSKYSSIWPKDKELLQQLYSKLIYIKETNNKIVTSQDRLRMQLQYFLNPDERSPNQICGVFKNLSISINGDFMLCGIKDMNMGNIKRVTIDKIWQSNLAQKFKKDIISCDINCHELVNNAMLLKRNKHI